MDIFMKKRVYFFTCSTLICACISPLFAGDFSGYGSLLKTDFSTDPKALFLQATKYGDVLSVERILNESQIDPNITDNFGLTPLLWAIQQRHVCPSDSLQKRAILRTNFLHIIKLLISKKADVNMPNWQEKTPLLSAALQGDLSVVELLVLNGAVDHRIFNEKTDSPCPGFIIEQVRNILQSHPTVAEKWQ